MNLEDGRFCWKSRRRMNRQQGFMSEMGFKKLHTKSEMIIILYGDYRPDVNTFPVEEVYMVDLGMQINAIVLGSKECHR